MELRIRHELHVHMEAEFNIITDELINDSTDMDS